MTRCGIRRGILGVQCPTKAVAVITSGCVHEHITTGPVCTPCAKEIGDGAVHCIRCKQGEDGHPCRMIAHPAAGQGASRS